MVYTYYMVCVTCVLIEQLVPAQAPKSLNGDILPLMETYRLPLWFLEAALQLKMQNFKILYKSL